MRAATYLVTDRNSAVLFRLLLSPFCSQALSSVVFYSRVSLPSLHSPTGRPAFCRSRLPIDTAALTLGFVSLRTTLLFISKPPRLPTSPKLSSLYCMCLRPLPFLVFSLHLLLIVCAPLPSFLRFLSVHTPVAPFIILLAFVSLLFRVVTVFILSLPCSALSCL
ncbi:hypothetical protein BC835DRAFT_508999 [Cytidiella melzeri]|nr:hypothetical protein BC835DRAFT_508999 [Cytidiella melzeri]